MDGIVHRLTGGAILSSSNSDDGSEISAQSGQVTGRGQSAVDDGIKCGSCSGVRTDLSSSSSTRDERDVGPDKVFTPFERISADRLSDQSNRCSTIRI